MIGISAKLSGNMASGLEKLAQNLGESALRSAGFAGALVFQEEAKANAPVDTGTLKDSIIIKRAEERSKDNEQQTYLVTVRKGKKGGDDAFYWRFVEFGTSKMAARPFMRPAFDSKNEQAIDAMRTRLAEKMKEAFVGGE